MERQQFETYIAEALDMVPAHIRAKIENVAFLLEPGFPRGPLLGLYHGIPVTKRHGYSGALPDTITIFQAPIEQQAGQDKEKLRQLIQDVVHHEIAHYFGFSEAEVRRWERDRASRKS